MKKTIMVQTILMFLFYASTSFSEGSTPFTEMTKALDDVRIGCEQELSTYCKGVKPGQGKILFCLKRAQDKLSPKCESVLNATEKNLKVTTTRANNVIDLCKEDLLMHCNGLEFGGDVVLDCLKKNQAKVSKPCINAIKDAGWME